MEQNDSETDSISGNKIICDNIECFASKAKLLCPKKRAKIEDLSTISIGYIKDRHPDRDLMKTKGFEYYLTLDVVLL
jgi:hypothetical protein